VLSQNSESVIELPDGVGINVNHDNIADLEPSTVALLAMHVSAGGDLSRRPWFPLHQPGEFILFYTGLIDNSPSSRVGSKRPACNVDYVSQEERQVPS
jgi:hypothetical protein